MCIAGKSASSWSNERLGKKANPVGVTIIDQVPGRLKMMSIDERRLSAAPYEKKGVYPDSEIHVSIWA